MLSLLLSGMTMTTSSARARAAEREHSNVIRPNIPAWTRDRDVVLEKHQGAIVFNVTHKTLVLEGGLGIGKTFVGIVKMLELIDAQPGVPGLWVEPTFDLIGSIFLLKLQVLFDKWGISWAYKTRWRGLFDVLLVHYGEKNETPVLLRSGDKPVRIVGFEVAWFILDEADQMKREVWRRCVQRHRHAAAKRRQRVVVYTPEPGFNWTHEVFHEKRKASMHVVDNVPTSANPNNPKSYVKELTEEHEGDELARVTSGKRMQLAGLVYSSFDPSKHVKEIRGSPFAGQPFIAADFNWGVMVWLFGRYIQATREIHYWGELVTERTSTIKQCQAAIDYLERARADFGLERIARRDIIRSVQLVPDASVDQHRVEADGTASNLDHLIKAGFDVRRKTRNPPIDDRVFALDMGFHENRVFIDKKRAPFLFKCISKQAWNKTGTEPDKDQGFDHANDAAGYGVFWYEPRERRRGNQPSRRAA